MREGKLVSQITAKQNRTTKEKKAFQKLSKLTGDKCKQCPEGADTKYRCCDKFFCEMVENAFTGQEYIKPNVGGIPYMSIHGCVIAPQDRPACTGYVCQSALEDEKFMKEYKFLCKRVEVPMVRKFNKEQD